MAPKPPPLPPDARPRPAPRPGGGKGGAGKSGGGKSGGSNAGPGKGGAGNAGPDKSGANSAGGGKAGQGKKRKTPPPPPPPRRPPTPPGGTVQATRDKPSGPTSQGGAGGRRREPPPGAPTKRQPNVGSNPTPQPPSKPQQQPAPPSPPSAGAPAARTPEAPSRRVPEAAGPAPAKAAGGSRSWGPFKTPWGAFKAPWGPFKAPWDPPSPPPSAPGPSPAPGAAPSPSWPPPAHAPGGPTRVSVENPSDGGFWYWLLKFYAFGAACVAGAFVMAALGMYLYFAATLPSLPDIATYHEVAATTTAVRGWDGTPLAELATERREILPFDKIPPQLVHAFLAAEDRRFYDHGGIDYRGILRALGANLRAGEVAQGGSTITQQVGKSFLSSERTMQRKIREAILARRLEMRFSKRDILTLYLNQVFLGHGTYGVGAAARRYFDKPVGELDLGEMATLAGLVRAPSRFSPLTDIEASRARRDQVLTAMVDAGYLTDVEANHWRARPVVVRQRPDYFHTISPYFAEQVRRDVAKRYGDKKVLESGLNIETTVVPWIDLSAQENVDFSLRKLDKRQGWRGPVAHLVGGAADEFRRRIGVRYGSDPPVEGRLYLGIVDSTEADGTAQVRVGRQSYALPPGGMTWAFPFSFRDSVNGKTLDSTAGVLHVGDVIWVKNARQSKRRRFSDWSYDSKSEVQWLPAYDLTQPGAEREHAKPPPRKGPASEESLRTRPANAPVELTLEQTPRVQGAVFTYDHGSGYVLAMVGGEDYDRSEFNRVSQACRQPGSAYKPIYYSLALDRGYGFGSLLNDVPRAEVDPITGEVWTPTNLNNTSEYQVTLEYALIWSKNVPAVQLFKLMGGRDVEKWARRLGITTPIIPDQALALGASCSRMDEMTRAFSAFARNGVLVDPVYIRRIRDRDGVVLEDHTALNDPFGSPSERLDRLVAVAETPRPEPVIAPRTAWLTSTLLRHVVTKGHAPAIRIAGLKAAGKTGTSSATMDTWFIGYTSRWMTSTWIGDDLRERALGQKDAAFMLTVPLFARYITEVAQSQPLEEIPWERPPGVRPDDTGGKVRTTMAEVAADRQGGEPAAAHKPGATRARPSGAAAPD